MGSGSVDRWWYMISAKVRALVSTFRGVPLVAVNMCARCGEVDDPETTARWGLDDDGDRMCRECAEKEGAKMDSVTDEELLVLCEKMAQLLRDRRDTGGAGIDMMTVSAGCRLRDALNFKLGEQK